MTNEKKFNREMLDSIKALDNSWHHSYDDVGEIGGRGSLRPADYELWWRGRAFLLELKATGGATLPYSAMKRHQVRNLLAAQRSGNFGLVLVKQLLTRPRVWVIPAGLLEDLRDGCRGSFALGPPLLEVERVPDPRGYEGRVWGLEALLAEVAHGV